MIVHCLDVLDERCSLDLPDSQKTLLRGVQLFSRHSRSGQKRPHRLVLHVSTHGAAFHPFARDNVILHCFQIRRHLNENLDAVRVDQAYHVVFVRLDIYPVSVKTVDKNRIIDTRTYIVSMIYEIVMMCR